MLPWTAALEGARTTAAIDEIARDLWSAYGAGQIGEGDAEAVAEGIERARRRIRPKETVKTLAPAARRASLFPPRKRRCVSPDRAASRARRRRLAYSGLLPPALAARFTVSELAVLRIVADEARSQGSCRLTLAEIAARAGASVTTARTAIRLATGDGLLAKRERRRRGAPNLPNVLTIVSQKWRLWISRSPQGGCKISDPTDITGKSPPSQRPDALPERPSRSPAPPRGRASVKKAIAQPIKAVER